MFGMNEMGGYSLSDIAAATGNDRDGFGNNNGAWWIIILFLFIFCGWGNNGFGNRNGTTTREEVTYGFDMNNLENKISSIFSNNSLAFQNSISSPNEIKEIPQQQSAIKEVTANAY